MKKWIPGLASLLLLIGSTANVSQAQEANTGSQMAAPAPADSIVDASTEVLFIQLSNGNWFYGEVEAKTDATIVLKTEMLGNVTIQKLEIKRSIPGPLTLVEREKIQDEERKKDTPIALENLLAEMTHEPDPNATRYLFAPSAFQLKQGEGYYQNSYALYNQASVGVSNNLTLGANVLLPAFMGLTAKLGFPIHSKVHVSAGGLLLVPFTDFLDEAGLMFANITFGTEEQNLTVTYGSSFDGTNILNASAMLPINDQTWFVTENYSIGFGEISGSENLYSLGVRRFSKRRGFTWDYAIIILPEAGVGFPFYSLTIPINPK